MSASETAGVRVRLRRLLAPPVMPLARLHWIMLAGTLVCLVMLVPRLFAGPQADVALRWTAGAALLLLAVQYVTGYRRGEFGLTADIGDAIGLLVVGIGLADPYVLIGVLYLALIFRSGYGSLRRGMVRAALYFAAFFGAVPFATASTVNTQPDHVVTQGVILAMTAGLTYLVARTIAAHERAMSREMMLARLGSRLLGLRDARAIWSAAAAAIRDLAAPLPGVTVRLLVDQPPAASNGTNPGTPGNLSLLPDHVRSRLSGGTAALHEHLTPAELRRALDWVAPWRQVLAVPLLVQGRLRGALLIAGSDHLPAELASGLELLAASVTLAIESAELARDVRRREARFRSLVQNGSDITFIVDDAGIIQYISPAVSRILGYDAGVLEGAPITLEVHPDDQPGIHALVGAAQRGRVDITELEVRVRHRDGSWRVLETTVTDHRANRDVGGIVINAREVTERKELEAQLRHQAFHDSLTGLANRARFSDRLARSLSRHRRDGTLMSVLFLDLDGFKLVNDGLGHAAGDALLRGVAARLTAAVRPSDLVARFGGDEFAVLLEEVATPAEALQAAERIRTLLSVPVQLGGREVTIDSSIGVVLAGAGSLWPEEVLRRADIAMYQAKARGKGQAVLFEETMGDGVLPRLELESDLRRALGAGELLVHYQPEVDIASGAIVGVEALVRWQHPTRGLLMPGEFIGMAEETGMILELGRQVLERACRDVQRWQLSRPTVPPLQLSVNLSPRQLADPALVTDVARILRESGLNPDTLWLELTESMLIDAGATARDTLNGLRALGVQLALDDFGTGYSSLSYLCRMPVGMLKVDRSFVAALGEDGAAPAVVQAMTSLAHALGMQVTAEGVETAPQMEYLQRLGCDWVQGYLLGRPVPAEALAAALETNTTLPGAA